MIQPEKEVSIAPFTYYKIGGVASEVYFPENTAEMLELLQKLTSRGTKYFILGGGTNVLVGDGYWDGAVIITTRINHFAARNDQLICGSGLESSRAAEIGLEHAMSGLEFLYKLPGSIGGALAGNARFDNKNITDALISVFAVHSKHGMKRFMASDLDFSYKHLMIVHEGWIICELSLAWEEGDVDVIGKRMNEIEQFRNVNHHFDFPSCGCVFKNDYKNNIQAGWLIDSLGLKGMKIGGAEVAPFHANFIINTGNATARDVQNLIGQIEQIVLEKTGITLEREIRLYGNF
ncbi:MAG: UDP-N-acetylmuramate dehydrogenase [Candidatus Latescibacteria bacterium]|jgi:UDP-N-acetylmuramate dehydrogenase|nr:UDP-N-acetylmuramate dehydrogenase [Candidatus Latescibacterota bacterium]